MLQRILVFTGLACSAWATSLGAQLGGSAPAVAVVHVDSRAGACLTVAYLRALAGLFEWKANFQSGYRGFEAAMGHRWSVRGLSVLTGVMVAKDAEWVGGAALWPTGVYGPFTATGKTLILFPFRVGGLPRYYADPARLFVRVRMCCQVGMYYKRDQVGRQTADEALGPSFQFTGRGWRVTLDAPITPVRIRQLRTTVMVIW